MDWKHEAVKELRRYEIYRQSLENILERYNLLNDEYKSIHHSTNTTPVKGGENRMTDSMINNIALRDNLRISYQITKRKLALIDKGMKSLTEEERLVLDRFYIHPTKDCIKHLMEELHMGRSPIYRLEKGALYNFTIIMYGISEL